MKTPDTVKSSRSLVAGIYFHPEAYPPTLNALAELADSFDNISVVYRNHAVSKWTYPGNVTLIPSGKLVTSVQQQHAPLIKKIAFFADFSYSLLRTCLKLKPSVILVYDAMSLYAYHLIKALLRFPHAIWYHNHDVTEPSNLRKYSIGWLADKAEKQSFRYLDVFTLPTAERKRFFSLDQFAGSFFVIPNYPAIKFYSRFYQEHRPGRLVRLIFQGQVAPFRGLETIISMLASPIHETTLHLSIVGPCTQEYKLSLQQLIQEHQVEQQVEFAQFPYAELPAFTAWQHIGLGILADSSIMHATIGTASNKLYEYAALGLPVLYHDSPHQNAVLQKFNWAFPVSIDRLSITQAVEKILSDYLRISKEAYSDFTAELNFESVFLPVKNYIKSII
jgi:hypothetical protein